MGRTFATFEFHPFSPKQLQLMSWWRPGSPYSSHDMVIADGSIRSGKTVSMVCGFLLWSLETYSGENFIIAGTTMGAVKRNVIGPMKSVLRAWGLPFDYIQSGDSPRVLIGENTYYLYGGSNERAQDRLQGLTAAGALIDEAALFPRSFIEQAVGRCSVPGARLWFNCNPGNPLHYIKTEYIDKAAEKRILHLHFTMRDNLSLAPERRAMYERMFTGVFYRRNVLGEWAKAEGLVYDNFSVEEHTYRALPEGSYEYYISCDYGTRNPFSAGLWALDTAHGRAYRVAEYYYSGRDTGVGRTDQEHYAQLCALADRAPGGDVRRVIIDPSAASMIETIRRGRRFAVSQAKNEVLPGISRVRSGLEMGKILIHESCTNTLREFQLYSWDETAETDRLIKEHDHAMDDIRYFVNTVFYRYINI